MSHDALAEHADADELRALLREHRLPLLAIGVVTGYLGAAPSLLWALSALTVVLAPLLIPLSVWLYTLVFAFSALWFVHYCLAELQRVRGDAPAPASAPAAQAVAFLAGAMNFGLVIVGDEILSGKRQDKHLPKVIDLLAARGLALSWARYVGDERERLTALLARRVRRRRCRVLLRRHRCHARRSHASSAAAALGVPLQLHPLAKELILERMRDVAREQNLPYVPERPDNLHRLKMGVFPQGAEIIPNPYNKIPGFSVRERALSCRAFR